MGLIEKLKAALGLGGPSDGRRRNTRDEPAVSSEAAVKGTDHAEDEPGDGNESSSEAPATAAQATTAASNAEDGTTATAATTESSAGASPPGNATETTEAGGTTAGEDDADAGTETGGPTGSSDGEAGGDEGQTIEASGTAVDRDDAGEPADGVDGDAGGAPDDASDANGVEAGDEGDVDGEAGASKTEAAPATDEETATDATTASPTAGEGVDVTEIKGVGPTYSQRLSNAGVDDVADLAVDDAERLADETGIAEGRIEGWIDDAREWDDG